MLINSSSVLNPLHFDVDPDPNLGKVDLDLFPDPDVTPDPTYKRKNYNFSVIFLSRIYIT